MKVSPCLIYASLDSLVLAAPLAKASSELIADIKANGIKCPLTGYMKPYGGVLSIFIVNGARRLDALRQLNWGPDQLIPVMILAEEPEPAIVIDD